LYLLSTKKIFFGFTSLELVALIALVETEERVPLVFSWKVDLVWKDPENERCVGSLEEEKACGT
jgi:hypothetical protein